jgi:hypothetical protein
VQHFLSHYRLKGNNGLWLVHHFLQERKKRCLVGAAFHVSYYRQKGNIVPGWCTISCLITARKKNGVWLVMQACRFLTRYHKKDNNSVLLVQHTNTDTIDYKWYLDRRFLSRYHKKDDNGV